MNRFHIPLFVFAASFVYYAIQACPTFYFWDSAELTAAVLGNGVPHPPGFPVLLLLAKIWTALIPMDKAYGLNLFSAFSASLSLVIWYLVTEIFLGKVFSEKGRVERTVLSLLSVLILGVSFSFGIQAVRFEIYSFNFACFAALVYLALRLSIGTAKNQSIIMILFILIATAALGAHHFTIALTYPGLLLLLYFHGRFKKAHILYFLGAMVVILIPVYYYVNILARGNPVLNWGDPSNWSRFIDYFLLKEFNTPLSKLAPSHLAQNLAFAVEILVKQTGLLGFILGLWGIVRLIRTNPKIGLSFLAILIPNIFSIIYFENFFYENYDQHGYLLFSVAIFALSASMATGLLMEFLIKRIWPGLKRGEGLPGMLLLIILASIVAFAPAMENLFSADLSEVDSARNFAELYLDGIPDNSLFITSSYNTYFCLLAYSTTDGYKRDVKITNVYNWDHTWGRARTAASLRLNADGISKRADFYRNLLNEVKDIMPVFVEFDEASAPLVKYLYPSGLAYKFSISDATKADSASVTAEIENYYNLILENRDIETLRNWVLWSTNRSRYYAARGEDEIASRYIEMAEKIGSFADSNQFQR